MKAVIVNALNMVPKLGAIDKLAKHGGLFVVVDGGPRQVSRNVISSYPGFDSLCIVQYEFVIAVSATRPPCTDELVLGPEAKTAASRK